MRVGNTVRRPRGAGHEVVESLLTHLEQVGFEGSPRFLGIDQQGRQILELRRRLSASHTAMATRRRRQAVELGRLASWLRLLHDATANFVPPVGAQARRLLPLPGDVWTHGDVGYPNVMYRRQQVVGLM